jgi:hypothetical protein
MLIGSRKHKKWRKKKKKKKKKKKYVNSNSIMLFCSGACQTSSLIESLTTEIKTGFNYYYYYYFYYIL